MERAGRIIGKSSLTRELATPEIRACAAWKAAAGKKVAGHTRAVSLVRDKLVIEVEDFVWQRQLQTLSHFLLSNLAREMGEYVVKDLDFRPMPRRMRPQPAAHARRLTEADRIKDPVLRGLYRESASEETNTRKEA